MHGSSSRGCVEVHRGGDGDQRVLEVDSEPTLVVQGWDRGDCPQRQDREQHHGGGEGVPEAASRRRDGRGAKPWHREHDRCSEQDEGGEGRHHDAPEACVLDRRRDVGRLREHVDGEPGAHEEEAAPRADEQGERARDRDPLEHPHDPEVLAERQQNLVQVGPAVQAHPPGAETSGLLLPTRLKPARVSTDGSLVHEGSYV